ncbi:MAG: hypothetical protein LCI03_04160 [Actinobacteria bacterium]|jgi:hypothetical protein|nr:hypothetical protein [Actinomycetota bacterium]
MTTWEQVLEAVQTTLQGDRDRGRTLMDDAFRGADDPAQRCVLAHYLADVQESLDAEIAWDERALAEFPNLAPDDLAPIGIPSAAALAPSLHLNLGDGYARRGDLDAAREQLDLGRAAVGLLDDDGYGAMIRGGLDGLAARLDAS